MYMASTTNDAALMSSELKLINSVELKLALANDAQFGKLVCLYLCPLMLKLGSSYEQSREKTRTLLKMIDDRLLGRNHKLPTNALLEQYQNQKLVSSVRNAALKYLDQAISLDTTEIPLQSLMRNYAQATEQQQSVIFNLICRYLESWQNPDKIDTGTGSVQPEVDSMDRAALSSRFIDLMRLNLAYFRLRDRPASESQNRVASQTDTQSEAFRTAMSGLNVAKIEFLSPRGPDTYTVRSLIRTKQNLLHFASGRLCPVLLSDSTRYIISVIGALDLDSTIKNLASSLLRRYPAVDNEETALGLYDLLLARSALPFQLSVRIYQSLTNSSVAQSLTNNAHTAIKYGMESKLRKASIFGISQTRYPSAD